VHGVPHARIAQLLERLKLELGVKDSAEEGAEPTSCPSPPATASTRCARWPASDVLAGAGGRGEPNILGHVNEQALKREIDHLEGDRRKHANQ
jgi:hypothetical protein